MNSEQQEKGVLFSKVLIEKKNDQILSSFLPCCKCVNQFMVKSVVIRPAGEAHQTHTGISEPAALP